MHKLTVLPETHPLDDSHHLLQVSRSISASFPLSFSPFLSPSPSPRSTRARATSCVRHAQVEFHKGKAPAPLPPDIGKYKCYVLEDEIMQDLMDVKAGLLLCLRGQRVSFQVQGSVQITPDLLATCSPSPSSISTLSCPFHTLIHSPLRGPSRHKQEATGHRECREEEAVAEGAGAGEDVAKSILKCLSETFEVQLIEQQ